MSHGVVALNSTKVFFLDAITLYPHRSVVVVVALNNRTGTILNVFLGVVALGRPAGVVSLQSLVDTAD
jgi:hypothetical protein